MIFHATNMKLCSVVGCHDLPGSVAPCEMSSGIFADPMKRTCFLLHIWVREKYMS